MNVFHNSYFSNTLFSTWLFLRQIKFKGFIFVTYITLFLSLPLCGCSFGCLARGEESVFCYFFSPEVFSRLYSSAVALTSHCASEYFWELLKPPGAWAPPQGLDFVGVGRRPGFGTAKSLLVLVCSWLILSGSLPSYIYF